MATFRCERFPQGHIRTTEGIVDFRDGVADVTSPALAAALREVPDVFGITEDSPDTTKPPARRSGRAGD